MKTLMIWVIKAYRYLLSPWLGRQCRFTPSCSMYGLQAIEHHGALRGGWLTLYRILRCNPFCAGGYDPVPGLTESEVEGNEQGVQDVEKASGDDKAGSS